MMQVTQSTADSSQVFDYAVIGGGPVGVACAVSLLRAASDGQLPVRIMLVAKRPSASNAHAAHSSGNDPRTIALSHTSTQWLGSLGAWPINGTAGPQHDIAAIEQIHISQRGYFGQTRMRASEHALPALGYTISYDALMQLLWQALDAVQSNLPAHVTLRLCDDTLQMIRNDATGVTYQLQNAPQAVYQAGVLINAQGGLFGIRSGAHTQSGLVVMKKDYGQTAVLAHVLPSHPSPGTAWERFTQSGPLALLPSRYGGHSNALSLVWCTSPDHAQNLMQLHESDFATALHEAFGDRLGRFTLLSPRSQLPLGQEASQTLVDARVVSIGNAAQTLHPVAGQGLNLGLRDVAQLVQCFSQSQATLSQALERYQSARAIDRRSILTITDQLPRLFGNPLSAVHHALGIGLTLLDLMPAPRKTVAQRFMQGLRW